MSIITSSGIEKIYDQSSVPVTALKGIDLNVEKGDFLAIVGPSGSGKTTLLNIVGGLDHPTRGTVVIDGVDISSMKPDKLIEFRLNHIGFVFQSYNLIPVLTAKENVEFIMLLQNISKSERERRAMEILTSVGLEERIHSRPSELSGGQQQRVAVARALASRPSFVVADEPTANLDSASAESLLDIMERLNHEQSMTFLFSTHDPRVMKRAHRILTLVDGLITSDMRN
jgi:putative ABC transport system ATP-binding protein